VLARHAVAITSALEAAEGELADLAGLSAGTVRIAAFPTASSTIVPLLLATMSERHPGIAVTYIEDEPPEAEAMVRDGVVDLAITFRYDGENSESAGLVTTPMFAEETVVVMPAIHALASATTVDMSALATDRWIGGCPRCRGHLLDVCERAGFSPAIGFETDNAAAVLSMVASGLGVALLPRLALATSAVPSGAVIRPHTPGGIRTIQYVTTTGAPRVPAVAATIAALATIDSAQWSLSD
jgi:DNA-binding transcriptional LysR family regulator